MSFALRGVLIALIVGFMAAPQALAQELAPLIAWVGKSQQTAPVEGRVARLLGLNKDGKPIRFTAVTTAYLDGARTVHLLKSPQGDMLLFSQGKARQGQWFLTNGTGALLRSAQWVPTSANPQLTDAAGVTPLFTETKAFWKNQLGRPVR